MFKAVPDLGRSYRLDDPPVWPRMASKATNPVHETAAQGAPSSIPIDITEWGLATDNGYCLSKKTMAGTPA